VPKERHAQRFNQIKETMDVIDAKRLTKSKVEAIVGANKVDAVVGRFGFFSLEIKA
jgi:hypothetical protein